MEGDSASGLKKKRGREEHQKIGAQRESLERRAPGEDGRGRNWRARGRDGIH